MIDDKEGTLFLDSDAGEDDDSKWTVMLEEKQINYERGWVRKTGKKQGDFLQGRAIE